MFGKDKNKGIRLSGTRPEVVTIGEGGVTEKDLWVHNQDDPFAASILAQMQAPQMPVPIGVFYKHNSPTYDSEVSKQVNAVTEKKGKGDMQKLLNSGDTWIVS